MRDTIIQKILDEKLIAILRGMDEKEIIPIAEALHKGGFRFIEVTFDLKNPDSFPSTARAISLIANHFKGEVLAGAGTVVSTELLNIACDAGALYIVSPNTDPEVIRQTRKKGLVSLPGALTPSECQAAHQAGADFIKLFPIGDMGPGYLKAIKAPLSHLRFLAVGGVTEQNIPAYLQAGAVGFGIGGNLFNKEWIAAKQLEKITDTAKKYCECVGK